MIETLASSVLDGSALDGVDVDVDDAPLGPLAFPPLPADVEVSFVDHDPVAPGRQSSLPPWPLSPDDGAPALVLGERHRRVKLGEHRSPRWCVIREKGLYCGLAVLGAAGTGKTSACLVPFVRQLLAWQQSDPRQRVAGLVLQVDGVLRHEVRSMLDGCYRLDDYIRVTTVPGEGRRWNPLDCPWLDSYSLGYTLAAVANRFLSGGRADRFWQLACTSCLRWVITAHRVFPDPWFTFRDLYECLGGLTPLFDLVTSVTDHVYGKYRYLVQISRADFERHRARLLTIELWPPGVDPDNPPAGEPIVPAPFVIAPPDGDSGGRAAWTFHGERVGVLLGASQFRALKGVLLSAEIPFFATEVQSPTVSELELDARITQWYTRDWLGLDERLRFSIVARLRAFFGVFFAPELARVFCPPRPQRQTGAQRATMLPPLSECIETGKIIVLDMPAGENPLLAPAVGVLLKASWLGALLLRPKAMKEDAERVADARAAGQHAVPLCFRPALLICDDYQAFAACDEQNPLGDEKMLALTRQARCIPIVAARSIVSLRSLSGGDGEAWPALLQTLRSRIFLALDDHFSLDTASILAGRAARAGRGSRSRLFKPSTFKRLAPFQAVAQLFDGLAMLDAHRLYLKPDHLPRAVSYWRQREDGLV